MTKPLNENINYNLTGTPSPITTGGIGLIQSMIAKSELFVSSDIALIKRALDVYRTQLLQTEESERETSSELVQLADLLQRLNNRI